MKNDNNGGNTCYRGFNNKNIKHAANPKEGGNEDTVESELQNERNSKRTNGISFWYGQGNMVRSVGGAADQAERKHLEYVPGKRESKESSAYNINPAGKKLEKANGNDRPEHG